MVPAVKNTMTYMIIYTAEGPPCWENPPYSVRVIYECEPDQQKQKRKISVYSTYPLNPKTQPQPCTYCTFTEREQKVPNGIRFGLDGGRGFDQ